MSTVIEVEGLRKVYGSTVAVDDVSFEVAPGEIFGLLGPNGAGKTTTLALPTARAAQGAGVLLWFVMMQISGPGAPFEVLPIALLRVSDATPLKHLVLLMQDPWFGLGWNVPEMLIVVGFLAGAAILTFFFARRG